MRQNSHSAGKQRKYDIARAFFTSLLAISALVVWTVVPGSDRRLVRRGEYLQSAFHITGENEASKPVNVEVSAPSFTAILQNAERALCQCRLDHTVKDQCAFIRRNCLEEETGLFPYLQFYYCKLGHAKPVAFILLTLWLGFLFSTIGIAASDFFCINLSTIAKVWGLSESMAGVTLLAFGNGSPDVFSTFAAMNSNSGSLAVGELIGAAGFITAVVAGSMAIIRPFKVAQKSFVRDVGFFIIATSFSMIFLADGHLHLWESAVMVGFYIFYVITVVVWHWNIARKSYRREREVAARGNFHVPGTDEVEADAYGESGADEPLDRARPPFSSLLIRPSFFGALEFRSVLLSLQSSRNNQSIPISLRRYSEDPWITERQQEPASPASISGSQFSDIDPLDATPTEPETRPFRDLLAPLEGNLPGPLEPSSFQNTFNKHDDKPVRWWPYGILPPPQVLISALFPTLYAWHDKNNWERILGIVAAPSVFFLAITLPVVESDHDDTHNDPDPGILTPYGNRSRAQSMMGVANLPLQHPPSDNRVVNERHADLNQNLPTVTISDWQTGDPAKAAIQQKTSYSLQRHQDSLKLSSATQNALEPLSEPPRDWNRWLLGTQIFTAPFFIVLLYWANNDPALSIRNLILPAFCAFIISLALFAIMFFTTTVSRPPRYRYLFCFLGFIVSIAWISTIASEVVGILKAVGIILGISDAILGLTIFAVGNSLGDLVANSTVARLGFPVMALGACFGGPMLNILLGIGLSGIYMTIKTGHGRHERHPEKPMNYKPFQIDISQTLIISGISLLVTLAGLLIVVPLNRWRMDKRIGWGLVGLWTASTVGNVVMEVSGWGQDYG
ncbi:hypothetical protein MMC31_005602 [Peltigera leucophlebia]|nr:hypothetical protein [Peltigera leucophlebia]